MNKETRFCATSEVEMRAHGEEKRPIVRGYAAVFDTLSHDLGGFQERIAPGAFDGTIDENVFAYVNHDVNRAVGRYGANLSLKVDSRGLYYEIDPPDTTEGNDLVANIRAGIVTKSSFTFTVLEDVWERTQGMAVRTVTKVKRLFDVAPLTMIPAYEDTDAAMRSLAEFDKTHTTAQMRRQMMSTLGPEGYIRHMD